MRGEAMVPGEGHGIQPELTRVAISSDVNAHRLVAIEAVEEEVERPRNAFNRWHGPAPFRTGLGPLRTPLNIRLWCRESERLRRSFELLRVDDKLEAFFARPVDLMREPGLSPYLSSIWLPAATRASAIRETHRFRRSVRA